MISALYVSASLRVVAGRPCHAQRLHLSSPWMSPTNDDSRRAEESGSGFRTYLHRGGKAASAGFPAGISARRASAAGKLGLLEEVWPFSPYVLKRNWRTKLAETRSTFSPPGETDATCARWSIPRTRETDATPGLWERRRGSALRQDGERLPVCLPSRLAGK